MDLFRKSMDSYWLVDHKSGCVLYCVSQILTWKDLFRIMDHESSHFQKICFADLFRDAIFKRFDESNQSSWILSTIDLQIHTNPVLPDSQTPTVFKRFVLWICFVLRCSKDLFCGFVLWRNFFKRFVLWIRFLRNKSQKGLFRIDLEGLVYESRILKNYSSEWPDSMCFCSLFEFLLSQELSRVL